MEGNRKKGEQIDYKMKSKSNLILSGRYVRHFMDGKGNLNAKDLFDSGM